MCWDTNQVMKRTTERGGKLKSAWSRPGACLLSTSTLRQVITRRINSSWPAFALAAVFSIFLGVVPAIHAQAPAQPPPPPAEPAARPVQDSPNYSIRSNVSLVVLHASV